MYYNFWLSIKINFPTWLPTYTLWLNDPFLKVLPMGIYIYDKFLDYSFHIAVVGAVFKEIPET